MAKIYEEKQHKIAQYYKINSINNSIHIYLCI